MPDDYKRFVESAAAGDKKAFGKLYEIFLNRIYRFVYYLIGDEFLAEDLTQNTFLKAWNNLKNFSPEKGTFQSYLYTIARNLVIDFQRKKKTFSLDGLENTIESDENQEQKIWDVQRSEKVHEVLNGLEEDDKHLIILRFFEDMHFDEISQVTGKEQGTLRVKVHRILDGLRQKLGEIK